MFRLLRFFIVFEAVLPPPGLPLASLLAPFGCLWAPFWRLLAPFGFLWAPLELSLALLSTSSPADSSGTSFLAPFGCLWAPFWRLRAPFWAAFRHRTCCKKRPAFRHWQHSVTGLVASNKNEQHSVTGLAANKMSQHSITGLVAKNNKQCGRGLLKD